MKRKQEWNLAAWTCLALKGIGSAWPLPPEVDGDYVLTICNEQGRCVEMRELTGLKAGQRQVWAQPKEGLPAGVYVITVTGQNGKYSDRELVLR